MTNNFFKAYTNKSEVLLIGSRSTLSKTPSFTLHIDNCTVSISIQVKSLGIIFDGLLSFGSHINNISRIAFFHLCNIARLLFFVSQHSTEVTIHALLTSRIDYFNS